MPAGTDERFPERVELVLSPDERDAFSRYTRAERYARLQRLPDRQRLSLPFASIGSASRYSKASSVARYVRSPTRTAFVGAAASSLAAVLRTSPAAIGSPSGERSSSVTKASPVFTAMRTSRPSCSRTQSRIASAARTARSGSSSCATGAPKMAITASPMNFSTVPPKRSRLAPKASVVRAQDRVDLLRVELLRARGEADEVGEEDGDDLALPAWYLRVADRGGAVSSGSPSASDGSD